MNLTDNAVHLIIFNLFASQIIAGTLVFFCFFFLFFFCFFCCCFFFIYNREIVLRKTHTMQELNIASSSPIKHCNVHQLYQVHHRDNLKMLVQIAFIKREPASVAPLDARPTGDQEVASSTIAGLATFFPGPIMKYFHGHSLLSADSRRAVVSFWRKDVHNTAQLLRGLCLPRTSVVR